MIGAPSCSARSYWSQFASHRAEDKRLALSVLAALLLHLLALSLIGTPYKSRPPQPPPLTLHWSRAPSNVTDTPPGEQHTKPSAHIASGPHARFPASSHPAALTIDKTPANADSGSDTTVTSPPTAADLVESSRRLARSLAREQQRSTPADDTLPLRERPVLPALERALAKRPTGETHLANGLIKVTTASGTTYCLQQPPPELARGGPAEALAVPTTCP